MFNNKFPLNPLDQMREYMTLNHATNHTTTKTRPRVACIKRTSCQELYALFSCLDAQFLGTIYNSSMLKFKEAYLAGDPQ